MRDSAHASPVRPHGGTPHAYGDNLVLHGYPYPLSLLARLGHPDCHQPEVGRLASRLFEFLFHQVASIELAHTTARVPTRMTVRHPDQGYEGVVLDREQRVVVVDVARAGILSSQLFYDRLNEALEPANVRQDHMFVSRTLDAEGRVIGAGIAAAKIGGPVDGALMVIPDPMGATGGSLVHVLEHYGKIGAGRPDKVVFVHLIVTPEYVQRVHAAFPDVRIHAIRLDRGFSADAAMEALPGENPTLERGLDENQYIVPGAGGLGEVLNNAWV